MPTLAMPLDPTAFLQGSIDATVPAPTLRASNPLRVNRQRYFFAIAAYVTSHVGDVKAKVEAAKTALGSIGSMLKRFEREIGIGGATAWNALNAYTGWLERDRPLRVKDAEKIREARLQGSLFGTDVDRSVEALGVALAL